MGYGSKVNIEGWGDNSEKETPSGKKGSENWGKVP